ncbi:MAG: DUF3047 domain-containing protein [Burkholderiales bacterium]
MTRLTIAGAGLSAIAVVAALASATDRQDTIAVGAFSAAPAGGVMPSPWRPLTFPKIARHTRYALVADPQRGTVVEARSDASASGLVRPIEVDPRDGWRLAWSWKTERVIERGDVSRREGDDYPVRLYVTFRMPAGRLSAFDRMTRAAAGLLFGDEVPDAGLSYIWDTRAPAGSIVTNPYTERVRMIVVESGRERLGRWIDYERDLAADWRAAFGDDPPPITGIAIMTDADNTGETARSWYGDIALRRGALAAPR